MEIIRSIYINLTMIHKHFRHLYSQSIDIKLSLYKMQLALYQIFCRITWPRYYCLKIRRENLTSARNTWFSWRSNNRKCNMYPTNLGNHTLVWNSGGKLYVSTLNTCFPWREMNEVVRCLIHCNCQWEIVVNKLL